VLGQAADAAPAEMDASITAAPRAFDASSGATIDSCGSVLAPSWLGADAPQFIGTQLCSTDADGQTVVC